MPEMNSSTKIVPKESKRISNLKDLEHVERRLSRPDAFMPHDICVFVCGGPALCSVIADACSILALPLRRENFS